MRHEPLSSGTKFTPYWWDRVPRPVLAQTPLPARADVVVIGSGYTGLSAALQTARDGRDTVVLDASDAGYGCSTRNGGQISTSVKPDFAELSRRHGPERAAAILREGQASLAWVASFVAEEGIDCDFQQVGRFHAAHSPSRYEALARALATQPRGPAAEAHMITRAEQRQEVGTDAYYGGVVFTRHASLDPARLHQGLLDRVLQASGRVIPHCAATAISADGANVRVQTVQGTITARQVLVATNGYTGKLVPWLQRRVIPIGSYIIATEPLAPDAMARLIPRNRILSDTRRVVYYYRASPDRSRILFGGRVSHAETDPRMSGPLLKAELARLFPELADVGVTHSWGGMVAYTFDTLAHVGVRDGVFYAMGYCGSGVGMATYLGMRIGRKLLGRKDGATAFDDIRFQTRPFYHGNPWFLSPAVAYHRWRDRMGT
jgi:glycine/D-amino acid oxidase-like deaminating enzyme